MPCPGQTPRDVEEPHTKPRHRAVVVVLMIAKIPVARVEPVPPIEPVVITPFQMGEGDGEPAKLHVTLRELVVGSPGLEPGTPDLKGRCSNQLS